MGRIAIVGGGIAGMTSAYLLHERHDVTLFEASDYLGGHTHTHAIERPDGTFDVDTGFIVFNNKTYPNFTKLLQALQVVPRPTTMSFSVRSDIDHLEYNGTSTNALFAQRRNFVRPAFWRMIRNILKFNDLCKVLVQGPAVDTTLGTFIDRHRLGREFAEWYIKPMAAAVWSTGTKRIEDMPIYFLARFFDNHGFLNINDRPQWYTITGGSHAYAARIAALLGPRLHVNCPIGKITRTNTGVTIQTRTGEHLNFDHVIIASHSNQALALLADATPQERQVLGAIGWSKNEVLLHTDENVLPRRRLAWAAWNYHLFGSDGAKRDQVVVTYHMNLLQGIKSRESLLVSLNSQDLIRENAIIKRLAYDHPIFDRAATAAQQQWDLISGAGKRTHYAGAYWFNGFHEDGVCSGLRAAKAIDPEVAL